MMIKHMPNTLNRLTSYGQEWSVVCEKAPMATRFV
jgi:hypothetical protein